MIDNTTTVTIAGKEVGLLFGHLQSREFRRALIGNLDVFFDNNGLITEAGISQLIYTANQNHRFVNPGAAAVSLEEVYEWLSTWVQDKTVETKATEIVDKWGESEYTTKMVEDLKKNTAKAKEAIKEIKQTMRSKSSLKKSKAGSGRQGTGRKK